jgi:hypothetical protein
MTPQIAKPLKRALVALWWLAAGYIPVAQHRFYRHYAQSIGCPASGDCYVDGSEHLFRMEMILLGSALVLWPACAWFLVGRPVLAWSRLRGERARKRHSQ